MTDWTGMQSKVRITGGLVLFLGIISLILAPLVGNMAFRSLWSVEPLSYIGALLAVLGLGVVSLSYVAPALMGRNKATADAVAQQHWSRVTQHYFDLFDHDLGRPIRRISGKERELRAVLKFSGAGNGPERPSPVGRNRDADAQLPADDVQHPDAGAVGGPRFVGPDPTGRTV